MEFFSYFTKVENLISVIEFLCFFVVAILLFKKTGKISYLQSLLDKFYNKEVESMKYRTQNYQEKDKQPGQTFDKYLKVYRYNKVKGEVEETDDRIDIQEMINSAYSGCLQDALNRFLPEYSNTPQDVVNDPNIVDVDELQDDLDVMRETMNIADHYREVLHLSDDVPVSEVFEKMSQKSIELKNELNAIPVAKEVPDEKKEIEQKSE